MKRTIICTDCHEKYPKLFHTGEPYPKEHIKNVKGVATKEMRCDYCYDIIYKGDDCHAVSIWADYGGFPYREWESEYIIIKEESNVRT